MTPSGLFSDFSGAGNENRHLKQRSRIIKCLAKSSCAMTIPEISKHVKISTPTTIKLVNELIQENWILDEGKKETDSGRRPVLYSLNKESFFVVGVEVLLKRIHVNVVRIGLDVIYDNKDSSFVMENTDVCLNRVVQFISAAIEKSGVEKEKIIGVGMGITGGVNSETGESFNYFNFMSQPLSMYLEDVFDIPTVVDNDTRVLGVAEQVFGKVKRTSNALIVNMSRGLGLTVILNKKVVAGGMGFAGEFGHMQLGEKGRLCLCGKKGCLGTEVSGYALEEDLADALNQGDTSINFKLKDINGYRYDDILVAAMKGDGLALRLLQQQGEKLGEALGNIINLLNPEIIVIGGKVARVKDLFSDSVRMGIKKTALINPLLFCKVVVSDLGSGAGPQGAASMVLKRVGMI